MIKKKKKLFYIKPQKQFIISVIVLGLLTFQSLPPSNMHLTSTTTITDSVSVSRTDNTPPVFRIVASLPVGPHDHGTVVTSVADADGVEEVTLYYSTNDCSSFNLVSCEKIRFDDDEIGDMWLGTIPPQPARTTVKYYLTATDGVNEAIADNQGYYYEYTVKSTSDREPPIISDIVITPEKVGPGEAISVACNISDESFIFFSAAFLYWSNSSKGPWKRIPMIRQGYDLQDYSRAVFDAFQASFTIPDTLNIGDSIYIYIKAGDIWGNTAINNNSGNFHKVKLSSDPINNKGPQVLAVQIASNNPDNPNVITTWDYLYVMLTVTDDNTNLFDMEKGMIKVSYSQDGINYRSWTEDITKPPPMFFLDLVVVPPLVPTGPLFSVIVRCDKLSPGELHMKISFTDDQNNVLYKHIGPLTISAPVAVDNKAPLVKSLQHTPSNITERTRVNLMAYFEDGLSGLDPLNTTIVYRVNSGDWEAVPYILYSVVHPPKAGKEGVLNLTYSAGDTFEYYINGTDTAGNYFESNISSYTVANLPDDDTAPDAYKKDVHPDRTTASLNYGFIVWFNASDSESGINNVTIFYRSDLYSDDWKNKTVYRPVDENFFCLELLPEDLQEVGITVNKTLQYYIEIGDNAGNVRKLRNNTEYFNVSLSSEFDLDAPVISGSHGEVKSDEPVTITAAIEEIGLAEVEIGILNYRTSTSENYTRMPIASAASYPWEFPRTATVDIPTQEPGTTVYYYIEGTDSEGNKGTSEEQSYKYPGGENELLSVKLIYWGVASIGVALTIATIVMLKKRKE